MRKLTSSWIPHQLIDQNRQLRLEICGGNFAKLSEGKIRLSDVVTDDIFWIWIL